MGMLRTGGIAAIIATIWLVLAASAMACEGRSPQPCRAANAIDKAIGSVSSGLEISAAKRSRSKRVRASQAEEQPAEAEEAAEERQPRYSRRKRGSRAASSRARKAKAVVESAEQTESSASATSRRRFRAFIDPTSMTDRDVESWRRPQADISLFFPQSAPEKITPAAAPAVASSPPPLPAASDTAHANQVTVVEEQPPTQVEAPEALPENDPSMQGEAPSGSVGMQATTAEEAVSAVRTAADSTAMRSLMLALGGVVTLASALRFLVGI